MTAAVILAFLDSFNKVVVAAMEGQTADQRKILWDRYIELTKPWHDILLKIANAIDPVKTPAPK